MVLDRTKTGPFSRWWWSVDRVSLALLIALVLCGAVLVFAGSPAVAKRIHLEQFYFVRRQLAFLALSLMVMVAVSMLSVPQVRRLATIGFGVTILMLILVLMFGAEVKGARRWLNLGGLSVQPSEFFKPCMAVVLAWVLSLRATIERFPAFWTATFLYAMPAALIILEPDLGMTITVTAVWGAQMFLAGLPLILVFGMVGLGAFGMVGAYFALDHVKKRIDRFLDPSTGDNYQVQKSLEAFHHGGLFGQGPGEGIVKMQLPDSHTDYIFAVAGEEFGAIACILILLLFAGLVLRMCARAWGEKDLFSVLAVTGLATQFGVQSIINMGVAVNLFPAKGMTLPFLSYGGSSLIAIALGAGMMLAFTRRRFGEDSAFLARLDRARMGGE